MSSLEALAAADFVIQVLCWVAAALFIYECLITLDQSVQFVLAKKWTGVTWLFALNQSVTLLSVILACVPYTPKSCLALTHLSTALSIFQLVIIAAFCSVRVYALAMRKIWLAVIVLLLGLVPVGINMFLAIITTVVAHATQDMCFVTTPVSPWMELRLSLSTRLAAITCDVIVLVVTLYSTWATYLDARKVGMKLPLVKLLIRDGTFYFAFLIMVHVAKILANLLKMSLSSQYIAAGISSFLISPGVPIIISRFILNLRSVTHGDEISRTALVSTRGVQFAHSVVGNMGETLDHGFVEQTNDDNSSDNTENWYVERRAGVGETDMNTWCMQSRG